MVAWGEVGGNRGEEVDEYRIKRLIVAKKVKKIADIFGYIRFILYLCGENGAKLFLQSLYWKILKRRNAWFVIEGYDWKPVKISRR